MKKESSIHQFLAGYSTGDAISNEARVMRATFRSWGFQSEIYSEGAQILPELAGDALCAENAPESLREDDVAILHLSIGSTVNDLFADLPCRKAILYHNMTPPDYLRGVQEEFSRRLAWGREQAQALTGKAAVVIADSRFNAGELTAMGYKDVRIMPLLLDFDMIRTRPDRKTLKKLRDGKVNVLFVGRCVPNKRLEDIISAFCFFTRFVNPDSRLILAGSISGMERYQSLLMAHAQSMELDNVLFTGAVPQAELSACYQAADLFLCMSEHEGFCIPLLESMVHDVPILAYAAAAVPETLDGAGILFREKRFDLVAEMMGRLVADKPLRDAVILGQRKRLERYERRNQAAELASCLAPLLPPAGRPACP